MAGEYEPLSLTVVEPGANSALWCELVEPNHYLGYRAPVGAQLRYPVRSERTGDQVLACLQWSSPAWKMAARDCWIGWSAQERARNLPFIASAQASSSGFAKPRRRASLKPRRTTLDGHARGP